MFLNFFSFYQVVRPLGRKSVNKYLYSKHTKPPEKAAICSTRRQSSTHFHPLKICPTRARRDWSAGDVCATADLRPMSRHREKHGESPTNHKCSTQNCTTHRLQQNTSLYDGKNCRENSSHARTQHTHTPHHNRFTALFPQPSRWAGARKELLDFMVQGRLTEADTGRHSIRTNQCPPPPFPIFYRSDALPAAQPTVSKHWR